MVWFLRLKVLKSTMKRFFSDADAMARIVNARHFERLRNLLKDKEVAPCGRQEPVGSFNILQSLSCASFLSTCV